MMKGVPPLSKKGAWKPIVLLHYMDRPLLKTWKAFINILLSIAISIGNNSSNRIQFYLELLNFPNSSLFQRFSIENAVIHGNSRYQTCREAATPEQLTKPVKSKAV